MKIESKILYLIVALLIIAPVFGVILAEAVGYHEPLDIAAEKLGLEEMNIEWTPFSDYTVPGLPDVIGYIISGIIGIAVIFGICYGLTKILEKKTKKR